MAKFKMKPMIVEAITFDELIKYGLTQTDNIYNNMPWSFKYMNIPVTHETDTCYIIGGTDRFTKNHLLIIKDNDFLIVEKEGFELMSEPSEELSFLRSHKPKKVRKFEKVKEFEKADFNLPQRSTKHSAGFDFYCPEKVIIPPYHIGDDPVMVRTGVKAQIPEDEFLMLVNRSSNPKKKKLVIPQSLGIIDCDYYNNPDNEGEMFFTFYNLSKDFIIINEGEKLGQGIFVKFGITEDDAATGERLGGFGSTGK